MTANSPTAVAAPRNAMPRRSAGATSGSVDAPEHAPAVSRRACAPPAPHCAGRRSSVAPRGLRNETAWPTAHRPPPAAAGSPSTAGRAAAGRTPNHHRRRPMKGRNAAARSSAECRAANACSTPSSVASSSANQREAQRVSRGRRACRPRAAPPTPPGPAASARSTIAASGATHTNISTAIAAPTATALAAPARAAARECVAPRPARPGAVRAARRPAPRRR